jgi:hypothetical protein
VDGRPRVTVRCQHRLDEQNLTDILIYRALVYGYDLGTDPSQAWLEGAIRDELADHGTGTWPYWREELPDDGQVTAVTAWASRQVARLGGTLRTGG